MHAPVLESSLWVLLHPSSAPPASPGIHLVDLDRGVVVRSLALPAGLSSPHALAFDGSSLWVSGAVGLYELDPVDGTVRSMIPGTMTQGLATDGKTLWLASWPKGLDEGKLMQIDRSGTILRELIVSSRVINDIAFDGQSLYYLVNSNTDPIYRVDPTTGAEVLVAKQVTKSHSPYSLAYGNGRLVLGDHLDNECWLELRDPRTGAADGRIRLPICGWITAIAFDRAPGP